MISSSPFRSLVVDTPNPLLYHAHRGNKQIEANELALINFLNKEQRFNVVTAITPMMKRRFPKLVWLITKLIKASGGSSFETEGIDPDCSIID